MTINWKAIAQSPGYKSLKARYITDVQKANRDWQRFGRKPMRDKAEFRKQFKRIIDRAINHSLYTGEPIESILERWETEQGYCWWMNYRLPAAMGRDHPCVKPTKPITYWRREKTRVRKEIYLARRAHLLNTTSKRIKKRWGKRKKELQRKYGRNWMRKKSVS